MLIDCHTHIIKPDADISVLNSYPDHPLSLVMAPNRLSCGIHPWFIREAETELWLQQMEEWASQQQIAAIGECGLDANVQDMELQESIFRQQIILSERYGLPLIIHAVKTHHRILELKKRCGARQPWLIHGYNGSPEMAQQFTNQNIFISFGENLIRYPDKFQKILNVLDRRFILLETDDSSRSVQEVYTQAAALLSVSLDILKIDVYENFKRVFE